VTVENKTLSNMEILMNELEKAKRATDGQKLDIILEILFKLLSIMSLTTNAPPGLKPDSAMIA
jgi:hypothetical protein